jgi:putative hydrolase of the HAD superfamily
MAIDLICLDADDTLWQNEQFFRMTEKRFAGLLAEHGEAEHVSARLLEAERRNLAVYGFGIKGFTLSMIETAIEVTGGQVPGLIIAEILAAGREMLSHPIEPLPHARETVEKLAGAYRLVLITKGDLFDQERKLAQSGLGDLFDAVEIVSEKDEARYQRVLVQHGVDPGRFLMVGNSMRSDVVPVVRIGGRAVHVPYHVTWALEEIEPTETPEGGWWRVERLSDLPAILSSLEG